MAFLVFEGLDGSGKSTLIQDLALALNSRKISYLVTREPGGTLLGDEIRNLLLKTGDDRECPTPKTELLLYEAIRSQHVALKIKPALQKNKWVLCDRFAPSTLAFQAGGRSLSLKDVEWLNHFATDGLQADLNVFLDLPVEEMHKRCGQRHHQKGQIPDRFEMENIGFHKKVRQSYLQQVQAAPHKWLVLDALTSTSDMKKTLMQELIKKKWLPT